MKLPGATPIPPGIQITLGKIDGISVAGSKVNTAQYEYEVCFKCHADNPAKVTPHVPRQLVQSNTRLEFASSAISFHPVAAKGKNLNVPSLRPPYTVTSQIQCSDCHGSESSKKAGGAGPNGPHGSSFPGLLLARYDTADYTPYSTTAYALCFNCHDNTKVVADSGPFPSHKKHVQDNSTACATCHDSHGISSAQGSATHNTALINFDTSIVFPDDVSHTIQYTQTAPNHGTCTLKCHNENHTNRAY
jgi:hypothetical protein